MKKILLLAFIAISTFLNASDLTLTRPVFYLEYAEAYAVFNISWKNAWNNNRNKDGVWIFFKNIWQDKGYKHILLSNSGHSVVAQFNQTPIDLEFRVSKDRIGVFISPSNVFRGDIHATIKINLDRESFKEINTRNSALMAYGLEMVEIPEGSFYIGDSFAEAIEHGAFYQPDKDGNFKSLIKVESQNQTFRVSTNGDLFYKAPQGYEGDQQGTIPATYPKGVSSYLIMKYEPTEGQYTAFLNSLGEAQKTERIISSAESYYDNGGSIREENGRYITPHPNKPCKFIGWDDGTAFADWAGLRPMTEFEFTKASRGTSTPIEADFPWGSNEKLQVQRLPDDNFNLVMRNGWGEDKLTDETKEFFGASYYWVMDLSGSIWERLVTIGHEKGRGFTGSHGDGKLSAEGTATNEDWPIGAEETGGVGYRGGGFYGYDRDYHTFNPFSPVSYRPYGGWHGTARTLSYGQRFVRSID